MSVVCRIALVSSISSAYFHRLVRGALSYADTRSGLMVRDFSVRRDMLRESEGSDSVSPLLAWKADGILSFLQSEELESLLVLLGRPRPVLSLCGVHSRLGVAVVSGSFAAEVKMVASHFRQQGLRSIGLLGLEEIDSGFADTFLRVAQPTGGLQSILQEVVDPVLLDDQDKSVAPVPERLATWLHHLPRPAGVFCPQMGGGGYLIRVCQSLGLRVPDDVAVIGTDDSDVSLATSPTLTSVVPVGETIGFEAARLVFQMIGGMAAPKEPVRFDAMDLRIRGSTGRQRAQVCDIAGAVDHINQNACGGLSVVELLKATQQVSEKTFQKYFKVATGLTPSQAIQRKQFEEARRLLVETRLPMTMVAERCGFGSSSDFSRRFRVVEGVSPSGYRTRSAGS